MNKDEMLELELFLSELDLNFDYSYLKRSTVITHTRSSSQTQGDQNRMDVEGGGNEGCEEDVLEFGTNNQNDGNVAGGNTRAACSSYVRGSESEIHYCNCGFEAIKKTVKNNGPKKGHVFFACREPSDQQCEYFEWAYDLNDGRRSRETVVGQGGTKQKASAVGGGEKKQRKGGLCHEPGHSRAKCPMKVT